MPRSFEHEGSLFLDNISKWQLSLPDGLVVHGDLDISGCPNLKHFGDNIEVMGKVLWDEQEFDTFDEFREAFERKQYFDNVYCLSDDNPGFE